ncbi:MAG: tRNA lysidine(34) synthetase TilS, partial [Sulfurovaceae bacterium]
VHSLAEKHGLEYYTEKLQGFNEVSPEKELRDARYAVFEKVLQSKPGAKIATAHTLDDRLETFIMRLAKGSKLKGLCSIPVKRGKYIRPMLNLTKSELYHFAGKNKIPYHEDYTNADMNKTRNHIRHKIVPALIETFGEDFYDGYRRSQRELQEIHTILSGYIKNLFDQYVTQSGDQLIINLDDYAKLAVIERRQILNGCVSKYYPLNFQIRSKYFEEFDRFAETALTGKEFHFDNQLKVIKDRQKIIFSVGQNQSPDIWELYPGQVVYIGRNKISLKEVENVDGRINNNKKVELICGDRLSMPLRVRFWEKGDFFFPLGLNKRQKLSDFFINQKINRMEKSKIPIVLNGPDIIWVAGLRLDERYKWTGS